MPRRQFNVAEFLDTDYNDPDSQNLCSLYVLDHSEVSVIMSCLRYAKFFGTRWIDEAESSLSGTRLDWAMGFIGRLEAKLLMTCDLDQLIADVTRIADALENQVAATGTVSDSIDNLDLSPTVNVNPTIEVQTFCSSCCGASEFDEPIDDTTTIPDQPPKGWEEKTYPDIPVNEYRCRASNYIVDYVDAALAKFIVEDVEATLAFGVVFVLGVLVAVYNFLLTSLGMAALMTAGDLLLLARAIILYDLDLVALRNMVIANRDDLVCAYYEGATQKEQQQAANDILDLAGASEAQITVYNLIVPTKLTTFFFYTLPTALGARLDRDIENHPLTSDCTGCTLVCDEYILFGTEQSRTSTQIVFDSVDANSICASWTATQRVIFYLNTQVPQDTCNSGGYIYCPPGLTLTGVEVISGSVVQTSNPKLRAWNSNGQKVVSTNTLPWSGSEDDICEVSVLGNVSTQYTVRLTFTGGLI